MINLTPLLKITKLLDTHIYSKTYKEICNKLPPMKFKDYNKNVTTVRKLLSRF